MESTLEQFKELGNIVNSVLKYLISGELQNELILIKTAFIIISAIFVILIIYFLSHSDYLEWVALEDIQNFSKPRSIRRKRLFKKWNRIKKKMNKAGSEIRWKLFLVEIIELFNKTLEEMNYKGETLDRKLRYLTKNDVSNMESLLESARLSQKLIDNPDYKIKKEEAKKIVDSFEKTLEDLEVF